MHGAGVHRIDGRGGGRGGVAPWSVPREWEGEPCFILGGGLSLKGFDVNRLAGRGRVLAVNNAYRLAPWADCLYFNDRKWFGHPNYHCRTLHLYEGPYIVTQAAIADPGEHVIRTLKPRTADGLSRDPTALSGVDAGSRSINLAALFGACPIVLLAFDMKPVGQWHDDHKLPSNPVNYAAKYIPAHERMARQLVKDGTTVLNATPDSALACYPIVNIDDILDGLR